jgi:hypothetical protein
MNDLPDTPFESIESAQEYIGLLLESIEEAQREVTEDIAASRGNGADFNQQALQLVAHNLTKLAFHVSKSRRILTDLQMLRRLLAKEADSELAGTGSRTTGAA